MKLPTLSSGPARPSGPAFQHPLSPAASVTPQTNYPPHCADGPFGLLCAYCSDDLGVCICAWTLDGVYQGSTESAAPCF